MHTKFLASLTRTHCAYTKISHHGPRERELHLTNRHRFRDRHAVCTLLLSVTIALAPRSTAKHGLVVVETVPVVAIVSVSVALLAAPLLLAPPLLLTPALIFAPLAVLNPHVPCDGVALRGEGDTESVVVTGCEQCSVE